MLDDAKELARFWLKLVDTDLEMARRALPDLIEPAAFHIQQAIEKLLKSVMVLRGLEPPKIHDLRRLYLAVQGDLVWSETEAWLRERSGWSTATRYGATDTMASPTLDEVDLSLVSVEQLLAEVRSKLA